MRIAIVGVGLIGGSIGLAARERLGAEVVGFDPAPGVLDGGARRRRARPRGAGRRRPRSTAPRRRSSPRRSARCPPPSRRRWRPPARTASSPTSARPSATVVEAVRDERFIGGHPLAGAANAGVRHARAELFDGATWYLTPTREHARHALRAPAPAAVRPRRAPRGARRRDARPHARDRLAPAARARQRARRPGGARAVRGGRAAARDRPELPRHHARRRRQHGDLARHLPRQRRRADRRDRRRDARGWPTSAPTLAAGDGDAVAAWNDGAREDRRRLLEADLAGGDGDRAARLGPQPPGRRRRGRARARQRRRSTSSTWRCTRRRTARRATSCCGSPASERAAQAEALVAELGPAGGARMNATFRPGAALRGTLVPPPDKSLSHRAALLGAMSAEPVHVTNYLDAADTRSSLDAVRALGALVDDPRDGGMIIRGPGLRGATPGAAIDVGNAGTLLRLLPGWLAGQPEGGRWTLDGDESIRRRPVDRVARAARGDGRASSRRATAASRRSRSPGARCAARVRAAGRLRADQELRAARRPAGRRDDDRGRARARAATTPSACSPAPAPASRRDGDRVSVTAPGRARARRDPRPRRPVLGRVPRRRRRARARLAAAWSPGWRRTGPASASSASCSAWAPSLIGDLEERATRRAGRRAAVRARRRPRPADRHARDRRRGAAGDRRAAARRAARLLRRGRDGRRGRAGAAR